MPKELQLVRLLIPMHEAGYTPIHDRISDILTEAFGGFTVSSTSEAAWTDAAGRRVQEKVAVYDIACEAGQTKRLQEISKQIQ
jgi:hypothetical protein